MTPTNAMEQDDILSIDAVTALSRELAADWANSSAAHLSHTRRLDAAVTPLTYLQILRA